MIPIPTPIFHITDLQNLPPIIASKGLHSPQRLDEGALRPTSIAHPHIQDRRAATPIFCGPGGTLHDYVPFYFAPRSPMLCAIWKRRVEGYSSSQERVIHLTTTVQNVVAAGRQFAFSDGHAIMAFTEFYDDLARLDQIDWPLMEAGYWADTLEDTDRSRRRQAEFLVHKWCPWTTIAAIGVMTQAIRTEVLNLLEGAEHKPVVTINRDWYY